MTATAPRTTSSPAPSSNWSRAFARISRRPVSYTVQQDVAAPGAVAGPDGLAAASQARGARREGPGRPAARSGCCSGLEAGQRLHPVPVLRRIAGLPLAERVEALGDPERRRRILEGQPTLDLGPGRVRRDTPTSAVSTTCTSWTIRSTTTSTAGGRSARSGPPRGRPREYAYDVQLQRAGASSSTRPMFNFAHRNLDAVREMITSPVAMFGLSDAGAHCGQICDGSMTTSYLSMWARDHSGTDGLPVGVGGAPDHPATGRALRLARPGDGRPGAPGRPQRHRPRAPRSALHRRSPPICPPAVAGCSRPPGLPVSRRSGGR